MECLCSNLPRDTSKTAHSEKVTKYDEWESTLRIVLLEKGSTLAGADSLVELSLGLSALMHLTFDNARVIKNSFECTNCGIRWQWKEVGDFLSFVGR